jgi:hypothetical protein
MHALIPSLSLLVKFTRLHDLTLGPLRSAICLTFLLIYREDHLPLIIIMHLRGFGVLRCFFPHVQYKHDYDHHRIKIFFLDISSCSGSADTTTPAAYSHHDDLE